MADSTITISLDKLYQEARAVSNTGREKEMQRQQERLALEEERLQREAWKRVEARRRKSEKLVAKPIVWDYPADNISTEFKFDDFPGRPEPEPKPAKKETPVVLKRKRKITFEEEEVA